MKLDIHITLVHPSSLPISLSFYDHGIWSHAVRIYFGGALFLGAPKSLQMVIAAMKLKDTPWQESYDQPRQHIKMHIQYFANKGPSSQGYGFSNSHVWM